MVVVQSAAKSPRAAAGFSLLELNLVIVTIALMAVLVVPDRAPGTAAQVAASGDEVASALRFARERAAQTGTPHRLRFGGQGRRLRLYEVDASDPATPQSVDVYHPITRQRYVLTMPTGIQVDVSWAGSDGTGAPTPVFNDGLGVCSGSLNLVIAPDGATRCFDPADVRIEDVKVRVWSGNLVREYAVDPFSARVTAL